MLQPPLSVPEPLRAAEKPSFTHTSVVKRLPDIARRTLAENHLPPASVQAIERLIQEIPGGPVRAVSLPACGYAAEWDDHIAPWIGLNWLEIPWFFAEEYFYVRMLEATGYFHPGSGRSADPYLAQKRLGLTSTRADIRALAVQVERAMYSARTAASGGGPLDVLARLLLVDLWGNQNDLSMWPVSIDGQNGGSAGGSSSTELDAAHERILVDDTPTLLAALKTAACPLSVDLLVDNAGYELVADLALAAYLLDSGLARRVTLHAKPHPVFVSDALVKDIYETLDFLLLDPLHEANALAVRLRLALVSERLVLRDHPFWVSPLAGWEMPPDLIEHFSTSDLVISKGDANYRRLIGDRHWPVDQSFASVLGYLPAAVLALRTLKSEIAVGLNLRKLPTTDPTWMTNGRWGLVQFKPSAENKKILTK